MVPAGGANVVLAQLDKLVEPLEKTLTAKLKSDAVKQEVRREREALCVCVSIVVHCGFRVCLGWRLFATCFIRAPAAQHPKTYPHTHICHTRSLAQSHAHVLALAHTPSLL